MTNDATKFHVDIEDIQSVNSVSTGSVSRPQWNPNSGYAREKAIEEARIQAMEEHIAQKAEQHDVFETVRFQMMEGAIADLQQRLLNLEGK